MKYVLAACALLVLATGSAAAEQSTGFSHQEARDPMLTSTTNCTSPYDFNHRGAGSDKSDELGVAYYNDL
ncbi:multiple antibiotic resistance regulatory protein MarB [Atlantibacter sp.]|nr:multiple antibiotic resistance regulatory protein MarB [Atlantibacter sp.]